MRPRTIGLVLLGLVLAATLVAAARPAPGLGYQVVTATYTLLGQTSDFDPNPVTGIQATRTINCPAGKVPLSGGGTVTGQGDPTHPVMVVADSRPTATGWTLTWLPTSGGLPGSVGTPFTAHLTAVCANPS